MASQFGMVVNEVQTEERALAEEVIYYTSLIMEALFTKKI